MKEITIASDEIDEIIYERRAMYYETDQMGVIHHSNYIRWFEEARIYYQKEIGLTYKALEELGVQVPVLEASCQYKMPVVFDEVVRIIPVITEFNGIKMTISYKIYSKDTNELKSTGYTKHCFVNKEFKPVSLKRSFPEVYEHFNQYVQPNN